MVKTTSVDRAARDDPEQVQGRWFTLRGKRAPSASALLPLPHRKRWALATAGVSILLLSVLYQLPTNRRVPPAFDRPLLLRLPYRITAGLAEVVTTGRGSGLPARLAVLLFVFALLFTVSRWRRAYLAASPGPVDVQKFENGSGKGKPPCAQLRSLLCKQLSETRLYPPSTGRSPALPTDFLDVVTTRAAPSNLLGTIFSSLGILSWVWPRTAYQVNVTLLRHEQQRDYGMNVTVTSLAQGGRSTMTTVWGRSWEDATCHAGYWVMAVILPVTRQCRIAPWQPWRGRDLPVGVFQAYNEGRHHHDRRQFDLALWYYGEALRQDPLNLELRLLVADVLEGMGLYLEALDVYSGAMTCVDENRGGCDRARRWWQDWCRILLRRAVTRLCCRWEQRPDLKLRYRYASVLDSERTVHEWFVDDACGERARSRKQMKERLRVSLTSRYEDLAPSLTDEPPDEWLRRRLDGKPQDVAPALRVLFRLAAAKELNDLYNALPWFRRVRRLGRARDAELTGRSLLILRDVWMPVRIARALPDWQKAEWKRTRRHVRLREVPFVLGTGIDRFLHRHPLWTSAVVIGGALDAKGVADAVRRAVGNWFHQLVRPIGFADHYSAACCYSMALELVGRAPDPDVVSTRLARSAVWHLRAALATVESGVAARLSDWILGGDVDLAPLRHRPEFRQFERDMFPRPGPVAPRPNYPFEVSSRAYARELIMEAAALLERQWHDHARHGGDVHDLAEWLDLDVRLWKTLRQLAEDRAWYWRDRALLIRLVNEAVDPVTVASANFPPSYPRFEEVALGGEERLIERTVVASGDEMKRPRSTSHDETELLVGVHRKLIDRMLDRLVERMAGHSAERGEALQSGIEDLDRIGQAPDAGVLQGICTTRAARWQQISEDMRGLSIGIEPTPGPEERLRL